MKRRPGERAHRGAVGEATYRTVFLAYMPVMGILVSLFLAAPPAVFAVMEAWRRPILIVVPLAMIVPVYAAVRYLIADYRRSPPADVWTYATKHDTVMIHVQFWAVLLASTALPWIAAVLLRLGH